MSHIGLLPSFLRIGAMLLVVATGELYGLAAAGLTLGALCIGMIYGEIVSD